MTTPIKTQCPNCQTYFNLPVDLLSLLDQSALEVRCGRCQHVFLANDNLIVSANSDHKINLDTLEQSNTKGRDSETISVNTTKNNSHLNIESNSFDNMTSKSTTKSNSHSNSDADHLYQHINAERNHAGVIVEKNENNWLEDLLEARNDASSTHYNKSSVSTVFDSIALHRERSQQNTSYGTVPIASRDHTVATQASIPWDTLLWIIGCLVLVLLLFAQYIIFNLNVLMKNPVYAEQLQSICAVAACSLPFADIEAFTVSDLKFGASQIESSTTFSDIQATLNNESSQTQILPDLKVSIYSGDQILGEFIAQPENYLLSYQSQFAASYNKPFMFTVPIARNKITQVTVDPIY